MVNVIPKPIQARAERFDGTAENLMRLQAAYPDVTGQLASEGVAGRLYLPTTYGTAVLEVGDYIVETRVDGVRRVDGYREVQLNALFTEDRGDQLPIDDEPELPEPGPITVTPLFTTESFDADAEVRLDNAIETAKLDYMLETGDSGHDTDVKLVVIATGNVLGSWSYGDAVTIAFDGTVQVN